MEILEDISELREIVDEFEEERLNPYTQIRLNKAAAKNKLRLLHSLMKSKKLTEEEAIQALGFSSRGIERSKVVAKKIKRPIERFGRVGFVRIPNAELADDLVETSDNLENFQSVAEMLYEEDPNEDNSLYTALKKFTNKLIDEVIAEQNDFAVENLQQSMDLSRQQAEIALGLAPNALSRKIYQSGETAGRLIGKIMRW